MGDVWRLIPPPSAPPLCSLEYFIKGDFKCSIFNYIMKKYLIWSAAIVLSLLSLSTVVVQAAWDSWIVWSGKISIADTKQFMTIPLSRSWLEMNSVDYLITEGWRYSIEETSIHKLVSHGSVDYAVPYGTPIYAPTDGWIHASYYNTTLWAVGKRQMYQGKTLNYGLWYWVQIIRPDPQDPFNTDKITFIQLAHLSRFSPSVAETIAWLSYIYDAGEDAIKINNYSLSSQDLADIVRGKSVSHIIPIKQWDLIGYVGNSWLEQGEDVGPRYKPKSHIKDPRNSRDEPHIHVNIYKRSLDGSKKRWSIQDPYYLQTTADRYPTHINGLTLTSWHLFKSFDGKLPDYAK